MSPETTKHEHGQGLGRQVTQPRQLPLRGRYDDLLRTFEEVSTDNPSLLGAGVVFFVFLSIFPALAASISLYAFIADPADIDQQFRNPAVFITSEV